MLRSLLFASLLPGLFAGCQRSMVSASAPDGSSPDAADGSGACDPALIGPDSTYGPPRATVPWTVVLTPDGGAPGSDAGALGDAGAASGCTVSAGGQAFLGTLDVVCSGTVVAKLIGGGLVLVLGDGSSIHWDTTGSALVSPPTLAEGQTASVTYSRRTTVVCPVCGTYETTEIQIRTAEAGPLIWIGRQGVKLADLSSDLVQELFGVGSRVQPACRSTFVAGCFDVMRENFDHVVETDPEQVIPAASSRHITTPKGQFDVFWTHSSETSTFLKGCLDGPDVASDNGFAASRTAPPPGR